MYDSGIGGLTVANEVIKSIPNANIIYVADNYNVPYGDKPGEEIKKFSCEISNFLINEGSDIICIACNMSTAYSLCAIKEMYPNKQVYGTIEFGAKEALKYSNNIGVLATQGTVLSKAYTNYIKSINKDAIITEEPCPEFVPLVENHLCDTQKAFDVVKFRVENILKKENIGALILGCTHYPYLIDQIKKVLPKNIKIINPATAMADFLLKENKYENTTPKFTCYATNDPKNVSKVCKELINLDVKCNSLSWQNNKLIKQ